MSSNVYQLYPLPNQERPLPNLYLDHDVRQYAPDSGRIFLYTNYITSLDGRIAVPKSSGSGMQVPKNIANDRDWRLFQELAAQADILISTGRYLRDWADGEAQEILQVDDAAFADLKQWREERNLKPFPDLAIVSSSLDFPIPDVLTDHGRTVHFFTKAHPDPERVADIEAQAGRVYVVGDKQVEGNQLVEQLAALGYQTVYSAAGPKILHMLLTAGVIDRLYLTHANRILGGAPFSSIVEGKLLEPAIDMRLVATYYDPHALGGLGQLFVTYDRA